MIFRYTRSYFYVYFDDHHRYVVVLAKALSIAGNHTLISFVSYHIFSLLKLQISHLIAYIRVLSVKNITEYRDGVDRINQRCSKPKIIYFIS